MVQNVSSQNKRLIKNTGLLYTRQIITLFLSIYTLRLTLQALGEEDLGIYATVAGFTSLISTLTMALANGTQRFIIFELGRGDLKKLNHVYCVSINIHIILSVLLVFFAEIIGSWFIFNKMTIPLERLWTAFGVFQISLFSTVLSLINIPNNAEIIAHEDMGTFGMVAIIEAILKCAFVSVLFFISWNRLLIYASLLFLLQFINRTICLIWCRKKYEEVKYHFVWDSKLVKNMLSVTSWTSLSNFAVTGFMQGVNLLLNVFFGPVMNTAYTLALQAYTGVRQFCSSFQAASSPQIVKSYAVGDFHRMNNLLYSVCRMSIYLVLILSLPFAVNVHFVMELWLGNVPKHTESFFMLLLAYSYLDVMAYPLDIAAQATGKLKKYSICVSIVILSTLLFSYVAFAYGAMPESVYIIAIAISFMTLFTRLFCLKALININTMFFVQEVLIRATKVVLVSAIIPLLFHYYADGTLLSVVASFIISITSTGGVVYFLGLTYSERALVNKLFDNLKKKIKR